MHNQLKPDFSKKTLLIALIYFLVILLTGVVYSHGLNGIFLLDDYDNIQPTIIGEFSWQGLYTAATSNTSGIFKRPISALSFALTSLAHGDTTWGFKYHNLILHLLIGLLVFIFIYKLLDITQNKSTYNKTIYAAIVSSLWLIHPLHVSTVLYSVQRMTQLSTLFSLLALILFLQATEFKSIKNKILTYFISIPVCLVLAILSKENGVLIPLFILLLHWFIKGNPQSTVKNTSKAERIFITLFGYFPVIAGATIFIAKYESFLDYSTRSFTLIERLLSQIYFIFFYIQQLLMPRLSKMGLYFDDINTPSSLTLSLTIKLVLLIALIFFAFIKFKKKELIGFGILFFFVGHLLESTIIPLELAFEHRNYLPSIGIIIAAISLGEQFLLRLRTRLPSILLFSALFLALLGLRVDFWSDHNKWQQTYLAFHPMSERAQVSNIYNLINAGEYKAAEVQLIKNIKILPDKISFKFMYLSHTCMTTEQDKDNKQLINDIYQHINTNNLTTAGFNMLAGLGVILKHNNCTSISIDEVQSIVKAILTKRELRSNKSRTDGFLNFLNGVLYIKKVETNKALNAFRKAYKTYQLPRFKLAEIKALLSQEETRSEGMKEFNLVKQKSYLFSPIEIKHIQKQIDSETFTFIY